MRSLEWPSHFAIQANTSRNVCTTPKVHTRNIGWTNVSWYCLLMYPGYILVFVVLELVFKRGLIRANVVDSMKTFTYAEIQDQVAVGRSLFVYEHTVLDLTRFMPRHPGSNLLQPYLGTEISRFIYGGFMCGKNLIYRHSTSTDDVIALTTVGHVLPSFPLVLPSKQVSPHFLAGASDAGTWKLATKEDLGHGHAIFGFASPLHKVRALIPGVAHCGTYLTVFSSE
jgi:hypothetical protein